jgi:hypothetical protein
VGCQRADLLRNDPDWNREISRATAAQRGDSQRGRGEGKAYRKLEGKHEHRKVMEEIVGRPLTFNEVVHHKDGNHLNNDPSNLEVMTRSEHTRHHALEYHRKRREQRAL